MDNDNLEVNKRNANPCEVTAEESESLIPDDADLDPNDGDTELDQLRGHTTLHARPARLEDEGQSGG